MKKIISLRLIILLFTFSLFVIAETVTVNIQNDQFSPASIEITVGDTVKWVNNDDATHHIVGDGFGNGEFNQGDEYSKTFNEVGVFPYACGIHPEEQSEKGIISVNAAGEAEVQEEEDEEESEEEEEEEEPNIYSEDFAADDNFQYACWNSEYLAPKQKVMNIDFDITYNETKPEITLHDFKYNLNYSTNFVSMTNVSLKWKCRSTRRPPCVDVEDVVGPDDSCWCVYETDCYFYNHEPKVHDKCITNTQLAGASCTAAPKFTPSGTCKTWAFDHEWSASCDDDNWAGHCDRGPYLGDRLVRNCNTNAFNGIHRIDTRKDIEVKSPDTIVKFGSGDYTGKNSWDNCAGASSKYIQSDVWKNDYFYWIEDEEQAVVVSLAPKTTSLNLLVGDAFLGGAGAPWTEFINPTKSKWVSSDFILNRDDFWDKENFDEPHGKVTFNFSFKCKLQTEGNNEFKECSDAMKKVIDKDTGIYFFNPKDPTFNYEGVIDYYKLLPGENTLKIVVEINDQYQPLVETVESIEPANLSYSCPEGKECLYPLPGDAPYTITNKHPGLYDLYFIGVFNEGEENPVVDKILITEPNQEFNVKGNILAKRVSRQVILSVDPVNDNLKFYGCSSASYLETAATTDYFESVPHCSIQAGNFCSYSETNDDGETIVNTWSTDELDRLGYQIPDDLQDQNIGYSFSLLDPLSPTIPATERVQLSKVFPTQNILSNALFEIESGEIPNWKFLNVGGTESEDVEVDDETIVLENGEKLISERISVPKSSAEVPINFHFQQEYECNPTITLIGDDGPQPDPATLPEFNTGENRFIIVEFNGPCSIKHPILQRVHETTLPFIVNENFANSYNDQEKVRSGAACCQENGCWNGFSCVEEMSQYTFLSEHLKDGRDYRCIQGQWKLLPAQMDWNAKIRGFCADETSCLVVKSAEAEKSGESPSDIYDGKIPICIKDKEFVFDHYCEKGNWTSRTKHLAQAIVEAANDKGEEFSLYCNSPRPMNSILELDSQGSLIIGKVDAQSTPENTGASLIGQEEQTEGPTIKTCFELLNDEIGTNLIPSEENTCINNVCVIKFKSSGKTAFATTLNRDTAGDQSFLKVFNIDPASLDSSCPVSDGFTECNFDGLEGDFWYHKDLNAVIYGKNGFDLAPGFFNNLIDNVINFWKDLFNLNENEEIPEEEEFLQNVMDLNKVFILKTENKNVRAVMERPSEKKELLVAEYEGFETPICDYINKRTMPETKELLAEVVEGKDIVCTTDQGDAIKHTIKTSKNTIFWWPELTGKLRVE